MTDARVPVLDNVGSLLERYDLLLCDIWGVVHDGNVALPDANETLTRFRARGGTVVLVSNAPSPGPALVHVLDSKKVVRTAYDAIVSSGDLALMHIREKGFARVHQVGPGSRDGSFWRALGMPDSPIEEADAVAVTGLVDDRRETPELYRPMLERALARRLPLVCVNPDLHVHVGADLLPCAGAIAAIYDEMGGEVYWAGKPHPVAYGTARRIGEERRAGPVANARILGVGDSVRTDLAAAKNAGVDALFIASGIHRDEVIVDGRIGEQRIATLFSREGATAIACATGLAW